MSSYSDVASALRTQIATALPGVNVMRGVQFSTAGSEWVAVGGIEQGHHDYPVMRAGRKPREESYHLIVNVNVVRGGADPTASEARAIEIMTAIEEMLADSPNLGLTAYPTLRIVADEYDLDSVVDDGRKGWRSMMVVKLLVQTRLN